MCCNLQHNRSHRRISNYNWNKIKNWINDIIDNTIIKRANNIINTWLLKYATNRNKIEPTNVTNTLRNSEKKESNRNISEQKFDLCDYPRPAETMHIHFIKGTTIMKDNRKCNRSNYPLPIESVFSKIDTMAEDNSVFEKLKILYILRDYAYLCIMHRTFILTVILLTIWAILEKFPFYVAKKKKKFFTAHLPDKVFLLFWTLKTVKIRVFHADWVVSLFYSSFNLCYGNLTSEKSMKSSNWWWTNSKLLKRSNEISQKSDKSIRKEL